MITFFFLLLKYNHTVDTFPLNYSRFVEEKKMKTKQKFVSNVSILSCTGRQNTNEQLMIYYIVKHNEDEFFLHRWLRIQFYKPTHFLTLALHQRFVCACLPNKSITLHTVVHSFMPSTSGLTLCSLS